MRKFDGLSTQEVNKLIAEDKVNTLPKPEIKSNFEIVFSHVFTLFNLYSFVIALALLYVKAYTSLFFVGIIVSNTIMFSVQEIRSRNLINKLSIIVSPKSKVIRNGETVLIDFEHIVLGDYLFLEAGDQIPADSRVVDGYIEANESLLTGEVDPVDKRIDALVLSGSFVVSGQCIAVVEHIKMDNYAVRVTASAKKTRKIASELIFTFKKITKLTSLFILPLGGGLLYQGLVIQQQPFPDVIVNTATALLGMLPQGLVLLTTVSLMAAVLRLGTKKTLIQDIYAIETLSQVDVLCLDKTGTLTYGELKVIDTFKLDDKFDQAISNFLNYTIDRNATTLALKQAFDKSTDWLETSSVPFSSIRKWSAITFEKEGTILLGAPEILYPEYKKNPAMEAYMQGGARLIALAHYPEAISKEDNLKVLKPTPLGVVAIKDTIREDAYDSLKFFYENDINVKIISGDNPETVAAIAKEAGVENYIHYIDASTLITDEDLENAILNYNIIGRSTPDQKVKFVEILQNHNQKVAMIGDGINDVLALKQADCSIAMGEGSDAALHIAQVVVMDGNLSTLVDVFKEGRQVINSITLSASMYYLRTAVTIFMAVIAVALNVPFPFVPFQVTLTNMFVDGFPSFMILFEKNYNKPKESIIDHVLRHSIPNALAIITMWLVINLTSFMDPSKVASSMFFVTGFVSLHLIYRIYKPLNWYRAGVFVIDCIGFALGIALFWNWLQLKPLSMTEIKVTALICVLSIILVNVYLKIITIYLDKKQSKATIQP